MDFVALAQAQCPAAIVAQLGAIGRGGTDAAADAALALFNQITDSPQCRTAVLAELLRRLPPDRSERYARMLMTELQLRPEEIAPDLRSQTAAMLAALPVRAGWERDALLAFIAFDIDRREGFAVPGGTPEFGGADFHASPVWNRALYAANFGDPRACERIAAMMDSAGQPGTVALMMEDVMRISPQYARPLIKRFTQDTRRLRSGIAGVAGRSLADTAASYLNMLDSGAAR